MLYIPFSGIFSRWYGLEGVNNENFKKLMKNNENISFIVGGFEGIFYKQIIYYM